MSDLDPAPGIARVLTGAWRAEPPAPDLDLETLQTALPYLQGSGSAALAWWRIRRSELRDTFPAQALHRLYRETAVEGLMRESALVEVVTALRNVGIEAILIKGWAIARLYPESGLRPFGDIDLYIAPAEQQRALTVAGSVSRDVDLVHDLLRVFPDRKWDDVVARSELVTLGGTEIRVLCAEDHLAYICVHFLKHGGWRPLWLCDVAVALERRPTHFDWDLCLGTEMTRADWLACTMGLAHAVLGADLSGTPIQDRARHLPRWLVPSVLREWRYPRIADHAAPELIRQLLHKPGDLPGALRARWLSPLEATVRVGGSFNDVPRWPYQAADFALQTARFLPRLARRRVT